MEELLRKLGFCELCHRYKTLFSQSQKGPWKCYTCIVLDNKFHIWTEDHPSSEKPKYE